MEKESRKILVPYDYTELSDFAVKHAINVSKIIGGEIFLLHIINDITKEATATKKLQSIADSYIDKYGVQITVKIRIGVVYKVIKVYAEAIDAFFVVMKTQPPRGKEKYLRSRSIKVMSGSKIPFIVVQAPPQHLGFRKIVFPIDFRKENKEKLVWLSTLSKYYTSQIYLYKPKAKDYRVKNNLEFSKRFLEGKNINYEIISSDGSTEATMKYANDIKANLVIIVLRKNISSFSNLLGLREQKFISNKYKIPVMVLNVKAELHKYEGFH